MLTWAAISITISAALWGGPPEAAPPQLRAARIPDGENPKIDGQLDESIWELAAVIDDFYQREPREGEPASEATQVRILYSGSAIFFGVVCRDSQPESIRATELRRDDTLNNDDSISILLDTFHDHRNAYLFRTNPLGTQFDAQITDERRRLNSEWDEKWSSAARTTGDGWTAEIEIPFKSLRSSRGAVQSWGLNIERIIRHKNEEVYWAGFSRDFEFWHVSQAGDLTDLEDVRTGLRLRVKPYILGGFTQLPAAAGSNQYENETQAGLEIVKASLTSSITADFTLNPDFAQAEVDEARFNLTRFSLFFPERREFFLERAGIFNFGPRQGDFRPPELLGFFSRRVGLVEGEQVPVSTGARITGDTAGFQFGFLNVRTRSAELEEEGFHPGDSSTVFRLKRKLLDRSYVGALFTHRSLTDSPRSNRLAGVDANFVLFDNLTLAAYWAQTRTEGDVGETGSSNNAVIAWNSDTWDLEAERTEVDEAFDPQLGFVRREGIVKTRGRVVWKPRPSGISAIRQFRISSEHVWFTNQREFLESRENDLFLGATFESGDFVGVSFNSKYEALDDDFEIHPEVTIPAGSYSFKDFVVFTRTYSGRRISGTFRFQYGDFFGGQLLATSVSPQIKVNRRLSIEVDHNLNKASLPMGDFTASVLNTRVNFNFSNRLLTSTTLQYDNVDNNFLVNWRLNYIYRPGDDLFIVYNEGRDFSAGVPGLINRTILVKFTHSFDF